MVSSTVDDKPASKYNAINVRRWLAVGLILSTIIIWVTNVLTLLNNNYLYFPSRPLGIDDRMRAIVKEIMISKSKVEDRSKAMDILNYTKLAKNKDPKVILAYTQFFKQKVWSILNSSKVLNQWNGVQCPYFQCRLTYDHSEFQASDAVLFHAFEMPGTFALANLKKHKPRDQKWVYFGLENPDNNPRAVGLDNYFHWTLNYRRDSHFFFPYGYYYPISDHGDGRGENPEINIKYKDKFIIWAVSHCDLPREKYVRKLMKYIPVDIYGQCAVKLTDKPAGECKLSSSQCDKLKKRYKFQLAFENSNCVDYITEKYWGALELGIVPIVLGGSSYSKQLAVPGSFINVMDFKTVKGLADYLKYLDKNDEAYMKYFQWRRRYKVGPSGPWSCAMCAALNMNTKTIPIEKLGDYWSSKTQCGVTDKKIARIT